MKIHCSAFFVSALLIACPRLSAAVLEGLAPMNQARSNSLSEPNLKPQWDKSYDSKTVGHLMTRARDAYNQGNFVETLRHVKDAKRRLPLSQDIKLTLTQLYIQLADFDAALDEVYSLLDTDPENPALLRLTGYCLEKRGEHEKALQLYERLSRIARTSEKPYYYIGSVLFKLDRIDEAIEAYERAVEINPDIPETHEALGSAWNQVERYDEAIASFKKAISIDPNYAPAYNSLGTSYFKDGKTEQGIEYVKRAIQIDPRSSDAYGNLGSIMAMTQNRLAAIELYSKALNRDPYNAEVWKNLLIAIDEELPRTEGWKIEYPKKELDAKGKGRWHYNESVRYEDADDTIKAARHLISAIRADSQVPKYFNDLGTLLGRTTYPILGVHFLQMALLMNPTYELAESNLEKHLQLLSAVQQEQLERQYQSIVAQNPTNSMAHYRLANFYATQGKTTNALPYMVRAVELSPGNIMPRLGLTRALYAGGQLELALETLLECFEINPLSFPAWQQLFLSLHLMVPRIPNGEDLDAPEEELEPPAMAAWHYRRALQFDAADSNQWIYAARHLHMATITDPTIPEYMDDYGTLIQQKISARVALPLFHRVHLMAPENETFKKHYEDGRRAAADERYRTQHNILLANLQADAANPQRLMAVAFFLTQNDKIPDAIPYLERAIEYSPTNQLAIITLARSLHQTDNTAGAIQMIDRLIQLRPENPFFKFRKAYLIAEYADASTQEIQVGLRLMEKVLKAAGDEASANLYRVNAQLFARNNEPEKAVRQAVAATKLAQKEGNEDLAKEILTEAQQYKSAISQ